MIKILISIILFITLFLPIISSAGFIDFSGCVEIGPLIICGGSQDTDTGEYQDPRGNVYRSGTWKNLGDWTQGELPPGMRLTQAGCAIRHDLKDYKPCYSFGPWVAWTERTDCCLIDKILTIGDWIFILLLVVAVIVFLIAAWGFLTAQGEPEKVKNARNYVIYSVIGVAVAFLAKVLVRVVAAIVM